LDLEAMRTDVWIRSRTRNWTLSLHNSISRITMALWERSQTKKIAGCEGTNAEFLQRVSLSWIKLFSRDIIDHAQTRTGV